MQNNVTYLSRKLQRSLDNNYNVIDMPAVIEIISTLEKTSVTKELLETTRLGKYINELRRKTSNESLAKRAKELLKKWRDLILPEANGIRGADESPKPKKRPASSTPPDESKSKRTQINGQSREFDFSDNSNCSVKELKKTDIIFINSDSNSSMPESVSQDNEVSQDVPKKRGRKKGSKNHKNLVIAAEESFTNKMAVSRNSKVKTTQELLADIQNRKPSSQDIEARTAQLTESLSRIEHKLNPQKNKNVTPKSPEKEEQAPPAPPSDDEIIVDVVGTDPPPPPPILTIDNLLMQLPPIDKTILNEPELNPCDCPTPKIELPDLKPEERITVQIVGESVFAPPSPSPPSPPPVCDDERTSDKCDVVDEENLLCPAKLFLAEKYQLDRVDLDKVSALGATFLPNVNGNYGSCCDSKSDVDIAENIVPNFMSERLNKPNENFQKYSISINSDSDVVRTPNAETDDFRDFREWHETLDVISYNDELLRILPYVIID